MEVEMKVQMFFKKQLAFCLAMAMIVGPAAAADTVNAAGDPEMGIVQSEDILSSSSESRRTMADELEAHTYPAAAHSINLSWSAAENAARSAELSDQENGVLIDEDSHPLWRFTVESNGLYALGNDLQHSRRFRQQSVIFHAGGRRIPLSGSRKYYGLS